MTFLEYLKGCVYVQGHMHGLGGEKEEKKGKSLVFCISVKIEIASTKNIYMTFIFKFEEL